MQMNVLYNLIELARTREYTENKAEVPFRPLGGKNCFAVKVSPVAWIYGNNREHSCNVLCAWTAGVASSLGEAAA